MRLFFQCFFVIKLDTHLTSSELQDISFRFHQSCHFVIIDVNCHLLPTNKLSYFYDLFQKHIQYC